MICPYCKYETNTDLPHMAVCDCLAAAYDAGRAEVISELSRCKAAHAWLEAQSGYQISTVSGGLRLWIAGHIRAEGQRNILELIEAAMAVQEQKQ